MVQHREVLAPEVLAATEPVDRARAAVLVELLREQLASPDVQHERDACLGETGPNRLEPHAGDSVRNCAGRLLLLRGAHLPWFWPAAAPGALILYLISASAPAG